MNRPSFSIEGLERRGFTGFLAVCQLGPEPTAVPSHPGVYVVVRRSENPPEYLERSPGSWFKGKDPTVPISDLEQKWVFGATTLYIGSGLDLRARIGLLVAFSRGGQGSSIFHWGGRFLWQLADGQDLQVAWREVAPDSHKAEERALVDEFEEAHGALPFANLRKPPRCWTETRRTKRMPRDSLEKALVGPAGEHYVLFRLLREGLLAALAPPRTPMTDILILSPDGSEINVSLQVKTRTAGADGGWTMSQKHEDVAEDRLFYAFLDLEPDTPVTYIVPSPVVADLLRKTHQAWLATPGRGGRPHRDHPMRRVLPDYGFEVAGYPPGWMDRWRERWEILRD
jgi:hypothetical protein